LPRTGLDRLAVSVSFYVQHRTAGGVAQPSGVAVVVFGHSRHPSKNRIKGFSKAREMFYTLLRSFALRFYFLPADDSAITNRTFRFKSPRRWRPEAVVRFAAATTDQLH
jgi:hypothetical protein